MSDEAIKGKYEAVDGIGEDSPKTKGILTPGVEDALGGHTLGQYQLMVRLGRGGMATVYRAYQPSLDRYVAVKVLSTFLAQNPDFAARFQREAQAIAKLNHPNILPVYDYGQEGELTYIVMRYVEGGTLQDILDRLDQPLGLDRAVEIIAQMAEALDYAHGQGIVHRDVKPSNVLMADGSWALLSDFGLAKMIGDNARITQTGVGMGTPAYIAPEQARGWEVDARSDIYALGTVLFEMLTGRVPFQGDSSLVVLFKLVNDPPPMPRGINPDIPEPVEHVLLKALAKDPADRFQRAGQMVTALQQAVSGAPLATAAISLAEETVPIWRKVPVWAWAAISGAILLVLAIAGATLSPKATPESPAVVAPTSTPMPSTPAPATATPTATVDVAATETAWAALAANVVAEYLAQTATAEAALSPTPTKTPTATNTPTESPVPATATPGPTRPPAPTVAPTPVPTATPQPVLTIYLRRSETDFTALSDDQANAGTIYEEGQTVYGDAAVAIGDTVYHFDEVGEVGQLPDPWRVEFEFAEELVAHTGNQAGFNAEKAWFWVGTLDSESSLGEGKPYHLTIKLYEGSELRESLQVFFTVADLAESGGPGPWVKPGPP